MATASVSDKTKDLVRRSFPDADVESSTEPTKLSKVLFAETSYTDAEKTEIDQWSISASHLGADGAQDAAKSAERYSTLNRHLSTRTTILGTKPSVADIAVFAHMSPVVSKWGAEDRTGEHGYHHIVRHTDFVQNSPLFHLKLEEGEKVVVDVDDVKFKIKPVDMKAEKARLKKEKEAAAAAAAGNAGSAVGAKSTEPQADTNASAESKTVVEKVQGVLESVAAAVGAQVPLANAGSSQEKQLPTQKKEKKPKAPKPQPAKPVEKPLSPALIDLRVGHILKAIQHPNADSLYVSTIAVGDPAGTENTSEYEGQVVRTVCSGLNGLVPLEEMQGRKIVAVCNLKPVTMRGVKSCAMVLAASPRLAEGAVDDHKGPVELVNPPTDAKAGERIYFEGWEGEPDAVLNPKKKIWETCQPGFTTTEGLEVGFDVSAVPQLAEGGKTGTGLLRTKEGLCSVKTLKGATVR